MPCSPSQHERDRHRHGGRRQAAGRGLSLHPELGRSACATDSSVYFSARHRSVKGISTDTAAADRRSDAGSPFTHSRARSSRPGCTDMAGRRCPSRGPSSRSSLSGMCHCVIHGGILCVVMSSIPVSSSSHEVGGVVGYFHRPQKNR